MIQPQHHPKDQELQAYTDGTLISGLSVIISTHLEFCASCSDKVKKYNQKLSGDFFQSFEQSSSSLDLDAELSKLDNSLKNLSTQKSENQGPQAPAVHQIHFDQMSFELPATLSSICSQYLDWRRFGEKSAVCRVTDEAKGNLLFIYVGPGEEIPEHGHEGSEFGCVIQGRFESEGQSYSTGDFALYDENIKHSPKALSDDGCLVVVWLEKRLNFLTGPLKPLNPVFWWYLNR